jgi:uncharacterized repeat protein (TIGR01451 family)
MVKIRQLLTTLALGLGLTLAVGLLVHTGWAAPGNPVLHPPRNSHNAPLTTTVSITYDELMDPATVNNRTFAVHGMQSGLVTGIHSVHGGTIIVTPTRPFHQGELVYAVATKSTLSITGTAPLAATQWQFRAGQVVSRVVEGFSDISAGLTGVDRSSTAWGDYDTDGDLDILLTGCAAYDGTSCISHIAKVYRNDGEGTFSDISAGLTGVMQGSGVWGDYDSDGDLDILLAGHNGTTPIAKVYRNNGSGSFTDISAGLTGAYMSSGAWGDYDNDGDLDILLTGHDGVWGYRSYVYRNDGGGSFNLSTGLRGVDHSSVAWGDYDNDGDLDILLAGESFMGFVTELYRNDGGGTFTYISVDMVKPGRNASLAWGDYDSDGDLDILIAGSTSGGTSQTAKIYRNDGGDMFTDISAGLTGVGWGFATWGDHDNDGHLDVLLAGDDGPSYIAKVYRNNGGGSFSETSAELTGVYHSSGAWGDYDNDGDLDVLLTGNDGSNPIAKVYRNDSSAYALRVTKYADPDPVLPGSPLTYTIRVANTGFMTLTASITDTLPEHITLGRTKAGTLILPGEVVTWTPVSIAPEGIWTDTVVVTVEHGYKGPLVNVVHVTTAEGATGVYTKTSRARGRTCWARLNDSPYDYTSVQAAVDAAQEGDLVKVAGHCFGVNVRPRNDVTTTGVVTQVVYISKTVTIQGGYTTTNWISPDPDTHPTTLDAERQGRVLYITGDISPTIQGLRITGGDADEAGSDTGGGVYVFTATATISNNWIYGNTHGNGAGLYLYRSNSLLSGNIISNNVTTGSGGGLFAFFADTTLRGNTIAANTAGSTGGGLRLHGGTSNLESNTVTGNTTDEDGGGLYIWGTAATLTGNEVTSNTAGSGGGLFLLFHGHMLIGNTVAHNTARSQGSGLLLLASNSTLVNNFVVGNRASGSVIYVAASLPHLLHNTIADNPDCDRGVYLTQVWGTNSTAILTNTILANHPVGIYVDSGSTATLESMLWHGDTTNWSGGGTINHSNDHSGDPAFVNPAGMDYHIGPSSAARDEGVDAGVTEDIDGDLRIDGHPDIGADELTAALIATKQADPDPVVAGSPLTYTIRVINGREVAVTATVTDTLPIHILPGGIITWTAIPIAPGGVWTETVVVTVDVGYAGPLTNVVRARTDEGATAAYTHTATVEESIVGLYAVNDSPTLLGNATALTATMTAGSNVSYDWAFGDGTTGVGSVVEHVYPNGGCYIAVVTASNRVSLLTATTTVAIPTVYIPLILKRWPPIPDTPVLNRIDNADQDNTYTVTWREADLATTYVLEEATNTSFSDTQEVYQGAGLSWTVPSPGKTLGTYYYRVKARNAWGDSAWSDVRSAVVTWAELIVNGGFESGPPASPWVQYSNFGLELIDGLGARTGSWGVYMGGLEDAVDQIHQRVKVPATAPSPRLYYWRLIRTSDYIDAVYDEMRCVIWDTSGNVLAFCGQYSNVDQSQNWNQATYDMSAFRGQTVDIGFKAFNDELYPTQFFIDDVSLLVTASRTTQTNRVEYVPVDSSWGRTELLEAAEHRERQRLQSLIEPMSK